MVGVALAETAGVALPAAAEVAAATVPEFAPVIVESLVEPQALDAAAQLTADFEAPSADPASLIENFAEGSTTQEAPTF